MRRSHLEAALVFPREPIYFEVIKSQVGISWWRLQSYGKGGGKGRMHLEPSEPFGCFF